VTVARSPTRWLGFPDVVQTGPETLVCTYNDGAGHGGGGGLFVTYSNDLGKTWGGTIRVYPDALNCPRLQKLSDGTLLLLADIRNVGPHFDTVLYDSTDGGKTWINQRWCHAKQAGGNLTCVPSRVTELPDGFPGIKAYSNDMGKTWQVKELPMPVTGRTCAGFLQDGRVMLTFREGIGRAGLWAWVGDPLDDTPPQPLGIHFNDAHSVGLKDGCLHVDNDGRCGQFTRYFFRPADGPETFVDVTAEVKVVANDGLAAGLSVPFVGKFHLFPDQYLLDHVVQVEESASGGDQGYSGWTLPPGVNCSESPGCVSNRTIPRSSGSNVDSTLSR